MDRVIHLQTTDLAMVEESLARQARECIRDHINYAACAKMHPTSCAAERALKSSAYWLTRAKDWGQLLNKVRRQNP